MSPSVLPSRRCRPTSWPRLSKRVRTFDRFDADNDRHGEHDLGSLDVAGERIVWKIDYYDCSLRWHSPDAGDASITTRVLTIMLASDY